MVSCSDKAISTIQINNKLYRDTMLSDTVHLYDNIISKNINSVSVNIIFTRFPNMVKMAACMHDFLHILLTNSLSKIKLGLFSVSSIVFTEHAIWNTL